jgi:hypothetical protein
VRNLLFLSGLRAFAWFVAFVGAANLTKNKQPRQVKAYAKNLIKAIACRQFPIIFATLPMSRNQ